MKFLCILFISMTVATVLPSSIFSQTGWQQAPAQLKTRWTKDVTPENNLKEYPRPQLVRKEWQNLNGLWDYAITDSLAPAPTKFDGKILVPYPIESALSGVKKELLPSKKLWYSRKITVKSLDDKRLILNFGAVDWQTTVFVNGKQVGDNQGGYNAFSFDITSAVHKGENDILVKVYDPTDAGPNPHGKQVLKPEGIMYTPTSGIWQTVWLETVPEVSIASLKFTPDVDNGALTLHVSTRGDAKDYTIEAVASDKGKEVGKAQGSDMTLKIPGAHLWSPDDPFLYDLTVKILRKGKTVDEVTSYFGMRKIEIKKDAQGQERVYLNNKYTFNLGVLDQGFWPDGLHTAPTDEALKFDVEVIKGMGFNTIRKHIKIEPARWYYHCDKLGMLVWQDMPYPGDTTDIAHEIFEKENAVTLEQLHNYPSIVQWVVFNEGWNRYDQQRLTEWTKKTDPSRIVNGHSGENYDRSSPPNVADKWKSSDVTDVHSYPGPGISPKLEGKARFLGEWGGVRVVTPGHQWDGAKGWGYIQSAAADFARKYSFMMRHMKLYEEEGLSASIYTQPFDVEIEENGLMTYDRELYKIPKEEIRKINETFMKGSW